jgi:hypothetical protein
VSRIRDEGVLVGLAEIGWSELRHAYGSAEDVPGLLRAVASGDAEAAKNAVHKLYGNIWHQGTVYEATAYAVPFLARLAAADMESEALAYLLGAIAESTDDAHLSEPGSARVAVAAQAGLLAPMLRSPDGQARMAVAWALAQSGPTEEVFPALRQQWDVEVVPSIRATLLRAMSVLDPTQGCRIAERVLATGAASERLVAALVCVSAGLPWTTEVSGAAAAWLAGGLDLDPSWWADQNDGPLACLLIELASRGDLGAAVQFSTECINLATGPKARADVAWAMDQFATRYRVSAPEIAAALVPAIADESSRRNALWLLGALDLVPLAGSGSFVALADALFVAADVRHHDPTADDALACLFDLGDPRAAGLLARDLPHRAGLLFTERFLEPSGRRAALEFDRSLLEAICNVLGAGDSDARGLLPGRPDHVRRGAVSRILKLLASWGPSAAPAVPQIIAILPSTPVDAAMALAAIGGPVPEAIEALRTAAGPTAQAFSYRIHTAGLLRDLTGDAGPLLEALKVGLDSERDRGHAARAARSIEDPPEWLVAALDQALAANGKNEQARAEAARTLCQYAGDTSAIVPTMTELLRPSPSRLGGPVGGYAVLEAACDLGPAAGPLIPELARFLDAPHFCPPAAEAILRAGLGDLRLSTLADHLVTTVGADGGRGHERALDLLREIRSLDHAAVSPSMLGRLRDVAERPSRVIRSGTDEGIIRGDEALRRMIRDFLVPAADLHTNAGRDD